MYCNFTRYILYIVLRSPSDLLDIADFQRVTIYSKHLTNAEIALQSIVGIPSQAYGDAGTYYDYVICIQFNH